MNHRFTLRFFTFAFFLVMSIKYLIITFNFVINILEFTHL